ncbi:NAD(P)/FAD-dependent oxidoreductase [Orbaceae bacterium ac157xtp]
MQKTIIILGAGASGLFCASLLAQKGHHVIVVDNGKQVGRKILMSGGGFCNFTNLNLEAKNYISQNPHFCKSAINQFSQWDFIALVNKYQIPYHEKELGQLFCDHSAKDIVNMLIKECENSGVTFTMQTEVTDVKLMNSKFILTTNKGELTADKVVVATGGLSMPRLGTTPIGYKIAEKFNLPVVPVRAGLVPLTLHPDLLHFTAPLAGISIEIEVTTNNINFKGNLLFTHRGLSGPVILQLSNYWLAGDEITINLLPNIDLPLFWQEQQNTSSNQRLTTILAKILPKRVVQALTELGLIPDLILKRTNPKQLLQLSQQLTHWKILPNGTEGYRTAEITIGGVSTDVLSSKTMQVKSVPNLYFIGEVIDVSGWLGGYNFQWAWSSAFACADHIDE